MSLSKLATYSSVIFCIAAALCGCAGIPPEYPPKWPRSIVKAPKGALRQRMFLDFNNVGGYSYGPEIEYQGTEREQTVWALGFMHRDAASVITQAFKRDLQVKNYSVYREHSTLLIQMLSSDAKILVSLHKHPTEDFYVLSIKEFKNPFL